MTTAGYDDLARSGGIAVERRAFAAAERLLRRLRQRRRRRRLMLVAAGERIPNRDAWIERLQVEIVAEQHPLHGRTRMQRAQVEVGEFRPELVAQLFARAGCHVT